MPATATPLSVTPKLAPVIVVGSIGSLKVAFTGLLRQTPALRSGGLTDVTVGGVVSPAAPVLKVHTWLPAPGVAAVLPASALPARSVAAVVTVAVKRLPLASTAAGAKVAVIEPTA